VLSCGPAEFEWSNTSAPARAGAQASAAAARDQPLVQPTDDYRLKITLQGDANKGIRFTLNEKSDHFAN
jgi:hypothetical protein